MALSLVDANKVRQAALIHGESTGGVRSPGVTMLLAALFQYLAQHKKNPDLQIVPFALAGSDVVIADAACRLYALVYKKPAASTTNAWFKGSDHATTAAAAADIAAFCVGTSGGNRVYPFVFPDGLTLANGLTVVSHTTVNGNTDSSAADLGGGFAIVGGA
jgi:hypothetical protein